MGFVLNGIRAASEIRFYQISDAIYYCDPIAVWHGCLTTLRHHFCQFYDVLCKFLSS